MAKAEKGTIIKARKIASFFIIISSYKLIIFILPQATRLSAFTPWQRTRGFPSPHLGAGFFYGPLRG
jgi:hypothetical protein